MQKGPYICLAYIVVRLAYWGKLVAVVHHVRGAYQEYVGHTWLKTKTLIFGRVTYLNVP